MAFEIEFFSNNGILLVAMLLLYLVGWYIKPWRPVGVRPRKKEQLILETSPTARYGSGGFVKPIFRDKQTNMKLLIKPHITTLYWWIKTKVQTVWGARRWWLLWVTVGSTKWLHDRGVRVHFGEITPLTIYINENSSKVVDKIETLEPEAATSGAGAV